MADVLGREAAREYLDHGSVASSLREAIREGDLHLKLALNELDAADERIAALEAERDELSRMVTGACLAAGLDHKEHYKPLGWVHVLIAQRKAALADLRECMRALNGFAGCETWQGGGAISVRVSSCQEVAALLADLRAKYPDLEKGVPHAG